MARENILKHTALEWITWDVGSGATSKGFAIMGRPVTTDRMWSQRLRLCALCFQAVCLSDKGESDSNLCPWGLPSCSLGWNSPPVTQIWVGTCIFPFLGLQPGKIPESSFCLVVQGLETPLGGNCVTGWQTLGLPAGFISDCWPRPKEEPLSSHWEWERAGNGEAVLESLLLTFLYLHTLQTLTGGWECWCPCSFVGHLEALCLVEKLSWSLFCLC